VMCENGYNNVFLNEVHCMEFTKQEVFLMDGGFDELGIDKTRLCSFLGYPQNLAFVALYHGEMCGFAYGYSLMSLNALPQLFVYAFDVLSRFQNKGIGSKLFQYIVDYSRDNGFSECFVITDKGNKRACRIYQKAGGVNDFEDEIVYVIKHNRHHA